MNKKYVLPKRILSLLVAAVVIINICFDGFLPFKGLFNTTMKAKAAYVPTVSSDTFTIGNNDLNYDNFKAYAYYYHNDPTFAANHQNDTLSLSFGTIDTIDDEYSPLGTAVYPFNGSLLFNVVSGITTYTLKINTPLFDYLSDDAVIGGSVKLNLFNMTAGNVLLANHVKDADGTAGNGTADWNIEIDHQYGSYSSSSSESYAGVIGEMMTGANVTLRFTDHLSTPVSSSGNVGMICDEMREDSSLTLYLTRTDSAYNVTATDDYGSAGALVGKMDSGSELILAEIPAASSLSTVTASGSYSYAGGLVGWAEDASISVISGGMKVGNTTGVTTIPVDGTVSASTGAGGLYGYYKNSAAEFDLKDYNITATVGAEYCGGVFGELENDKGEAASVSLTIKNTGDAGTVNVDSGDSANYRYFGGIAGKYTTDDLKNSLILDNFSVTANSNISLDSFGGAIGTVESAAYIKVDGVQVTATGTAESDSASYFGGLIGKTSDSHGVFVDLGDFTLSADQSGFNGGGIVGSFENGVLRLSGTTDLSSAKSQSGGQLIGENDNVLVYALGNGTNGTAYNNGWTFKRSNASQVDDLGTWGEVVRIADVEDTTNGILTLSTTDHTVTVKAAETSMGTPEDFAKTALNIQLNQGQDYDCLLFTEGAANTRSSLLSTTLSLTDDISLSGTGINGFMRDGSDSVGEFTGTLDGNSHKITLAIGEEYGLNSSGNPVSSGEGIGQIYRHPYNGLFAIIGNGTTGTGTVNSLTIDGTIIVRNKIDGMNIGGIAAVSKGNTTLNGITANQTINYGEPSAVSGSSADGKNIGGMIGVANNSSDNGTISITGTNTISTVIKISDNYKSWTCVGAAVGKITSPKFTVDIAQGGSDKLTVSHTMSVADGTSSSSTADGGGLIGYITSGDYANRKINIKNLDFNGCTIVNTATENGGGFLGYAWLDTDTTIDGLTVTDGTITNSSPNVGVMCYEATGRWKVNDLEITKMSLSGGAGTSLGMLVNKAYSGNNGLYLDVLKSGYTLTNKSGDTGISLPNSLGIYDELAAYSASKVIEGGNGAGVVSINMNAGRHDPEADPADNYTKVKITETGTYQDQLTSASSSALGSAKYANSNTRYYYNLDVMSKDDAEQNILLWSVNQYAASNIKSLFDSTSTPFDFSEETDIRLSDYSYYPVYSVSSQTLRNINVDFGYSGIYEIEGNSFNTDSYNRDPGAQNQHYLMQSGLFINSNEGATLTLNNVEFSGDFLENATYRGVLISGTAKGGINIDGLELDGIVPTYNNSGTISNYNLGYLLVKKVTRETALKPNIQINLKDISTSNKYTINNATSTVTRSLFGDVYGPAIGINVEDIKLDARSSNGGLTALDSVYNTVNSIFTHATLFNSLKTTQTANMIYNYTWDKDWGTGGRCVTYGREVSESVEYRDLENKYYTDTTRYTHPSNNNWTTAEYDFSSWRPYVATAYNQTLDDKGCFYRELKVNVAPAAYARGCGTYNDPYIIDSGSKLEAIAGLISDPTKTNELPVLQLPKTLYDGLEANTTGARWCVNKNDHAVYEYNEQSGKYISTDSSVTAEWTVDNVRLYLANAYYSLAASSDDQNGNIVLSDQFVGLGGTDTTGKFAFRGVIVGNNRTIVNNSQNPLVKVTNGCVLKDLTVKQNVDVNVTSQTNAAVNNAYFGYNSACQYYGGLIGEIMGGDNIIDNSYVDFSSTKVTIQGKNGSMVPVGGYVGVIVFGGLIFKNIDASKTTLDNTGLNVVFRNDSTVTTTGVNLASETAVVDGNPVKNQEAWAAIYVNPLVGRVINGYAVNETGGNALDVSGNSVDQFSNSEDGKYHDDAGSTRSNTTEHTLKNGKKHYPIADITQSLAKLDVTKVATENEDGNINVPNAQALFVLSLITQTCAGTATEAKGGYVNSLSYGIYTNKINNVDTACVYGMSHNANYSDVGTNEALVADDPSTANVDETSVIDYQIKACVDTAGNTKQTNYPIPYIIKYYTVGTDAIETESIPETIQEEYDEITQPGSRYLGSTLTSGSFAIRGRRNGDNRDEYLTSEVIPNKYNRNYTLKSTLKNNGEQVDHFSDATEFYFEAKPDGSANMYCIYYLDSNNNNAKKYLAISDVESRNGISANKDRGNLEVSDTPCYFEVVKWENDTWSIAWKSTANNKDLYMTFDNGRGYFCGYINLDAGSKLALYAKSAVTEHKTRDKEITRTLTHVVCNYPARCVTSSSRYYDICLTGNGTYLLPDSFRGLGCVGNYNENYCIKLDSFDGSGLTIDEDIYLNKYETDNYFNLIHNGTTQSVNTGEVYDVNNASKNHGIGLFDSIKTRNANSTYGSISNFTLSGSVNTEIFSNSYVAASHELAIYQSSLARWLSVGGVVGTGVNQSNIVFDQIILDGFSVCGSSAVGGIIGFSCNSGDYFIEVNRCKADANGLSVKMNSGSDLDKEGRARNAIGGFVGKCFEGKVNIYGTALKAGNTVFSNYSTVKINSFGFEESIKTDYYCCAGGLVGFAGDGCQVYDMYVVSGNSSSPVTIGGSKISFAGGICGAMQSREDGSKINNYKPTCYANFVNCTVENINIQGQMVGGLYGGKWGSTGWTPYSITVDNCKIVGDSTNPNTIKAVKVYSNDIFAGGFIGRGLVLTNGNPNIEIKDSTVSDFIITGKCCGGFIGYAGSYANDSTVTCYIHDSSVEDCVIGASGDYAGGAIGQVQPKNTSVSAEKANKMLGYNIKLENVTAGTGATMGAWIGQLNSGKTSIQFTGIGIYGNGFSNNVGSSDSGASLTDLSFVFADYDESCASYDTVNNPVSGLNCADHSGTSTAHVEMPKYPYVNVSPQSDLGTDEIISGDGAVLSNTSSTTSAYSGKTAEKTMALKIYEDIVAGTDSRRYTTFVDTAIYNGNGIDEYMKRSTDSEGDRISTWETETNTQLAGVDDFAMIIIGNASAEETTNLIIRYIQLVTNTATDYSISSSYYTVVPSACVYNTTTHSFEITNGTASINYKPGSTSSNAFTVNNAGADSLAVNKFTLLDVQFKDPLHTDKIAYHLYIPVYVKRSLNVSFSSTALSGTDALSDNYLSGLLSNNMFVVENLDTWVTAYIRYSYETTEIQALLDSGLLGWNGNKDVVLNFSDSATGTELPNNTLLVLIDPNGNIDTAYYASGSDLSGNTFSLSDFHRSYTGGAAFDEQKFGDIIGGSVTVTEEAGNYNLSDSSDYDVRVGDDYYKFVGGGSGSYNITANSAFNEDYYISMLVPSSDIVYMFDIQSPDSLSGDANTDVATGNVVTILLGDLYEYEFTGADVDPNDLVITDTNNKITVDVTSTVKLKGDNKAFYAGYLNGNNVSLYHADVVTLNRYYSGGSDSVLSGYGDINVTCSVENTSGTVTTLNRSAEVINSNITVKTGDIRSQVTEDINNVNYKGATITQTIEIEFTNIEEEFPSRPSDQITQYGVSATVTSNIAYVEDDVIYSGKKAIFADTKRYYIENANSATLKYEANVELDEYDSIGAASYNYSRLGNNGLDRTLTCIWPENDEGMPINATGKYNASAITNFDDAKTVRYTLTLFKKTDVMEGNTVTRVEYQQVDIDDYLKDVKLFGGVGGNTVLNKVTELSNDRKYVFTEPVSTANVDERLFTIGTYFEVVTGDDFHDYANYRVVLEVSLLNRGGNVISNSSQKDHIVYTNAKIYPEVIQQQSGS